MDNLKYNGIHHQFLLNYINYIFYFRAVCYSIFYVLLAVNGLLFAILFMPFGLPAPKEIIWLPNLLIISLPDEDYSRHAS